MRSSKPPKSKDASKRRNSISAQKKIEALERKLEQLSHSEERYRSLAASAYDGIMIVDRSGEIEFANVQLEKMFGYEPGELLKKQYQILIAERHREKHLLLHRKYMDNPVQRVMGQGLNLVGRCKDGREFPIDVSLSPFRSNSGVYVSAVVRDISQFKKAEEERTKLAEREKAAREDAETANRIKDEFLAILSHELRTPLTTILGWAQVLRSTKPDPKSLANGLAIIEQCAQVQGQLINDLLDISRIQAGKLSIDARVIDLVDVLNLSVESARNLAEKKSIQIKTAIEPQECMILADATRVQQVFWNLLTNSIKFTPSGGQISVSLTIIESAEGKMAQAQVSDTGTGIKPEFLPRIFERFTQENTSMTRLHGGLGLGLTLVKSIVEILDGKVTAASQGEGKGATFTVTLPIIPYENMPSYTAPQAIHKETETIRLDGMQVLVVDDDPSNRELFSVMLDSVGAKVRLAESAERAREIMAEYKPDILISDISMPAEDGYSFIRRLRALSEDQGGKIPAIALTAYASQDDIRRAIEAGFSTHVAKPVNQMTLIREIQRLVKK